MQVNSFSSYAEWHFSRFPRYFHHSILGWYLDLLKNSGGTWYTRLTALERLREYGLYAKLEKCSFDQRQVDFLGYVVSWNGISMDRAMVQTVLDWQTPLFVRDVQCFLGFTKFYDKFIKDYSKIVLPLTQHKRIDHLYGVQMQTLHLRV